MENNGIFCTLPYYFRAERHQGELCQLEVLESEGDADNGDAENQTDAQMFDRQRHAGENDPQDIHDQRNRAGTPHDFLPERTAGQFRKLEALHADRNADDGHAPQQSADKPRQSAEKSAENKPYKIAENTQFFFLRDLGMASLYHNFSVCAEFFRIFMKF